MLRNKRDHHAMLMFVKASAVSPQCDLTEQQYKSLLTPYIMLLLKDQPKCVSKVELTPNDDSDTASVDSSEGMLTVKTHASVHHGHL